MDTHLFEEPAPRMSLSGRCDEIVVRLLFIERLQNTNDLFTKLPFHTTSTDSRLLLLYRALSLSLLVIVSHLVSLVRRTCTVIERCEESVCYKTKDSFVGVHTNMSS